MKTVRLACLLSLAAWAVPAATTSIAIAAPAQDGASSGPVVRAERSRLAIDLAHSAQAHGAFLDEIAELRRLGKADEFRARLDLELESQHIRRAGLREFVAEHGGEIVSESWLTDTLVVEFDAQIDADVTAELSQRTDVANVTERQESYRSPQTLKAAINAAHHNIIGVHQSTSGGVPVEGTGVTVAIIDTGIDLESAALGRPHRAFYRDGDETTNAGGLSGSRILSAEGVFFQFGGFPLGSTVPEDVHGHGTRIASIATGAQYNTTLGVSDGAAPDAFIRSYRIDDEANPGLASTLVMDDAFEAAAAQPDVRVINMSYDGTFESEHFLNQTMDAVVRSGVLVTLSAGNNGTGSFFHGCFNPLSVGASDLQSKEPYNEPSFLVSAIGPLDDGRRYPDLIAVGEDLTAALIDAEGTAQASYGTSGSAALVAGTAALLLQANSALSELELRAILLDTVETVTAGNPDARGLGYLASKDAYDRALISGLTTRRSVTQPITERFSFTLQQGEAFSATTVWNREQIDQPLIGDIDLTVFDPTGVPVASASSRVDNEEQLRFTAGTSGTFTIEVDTLALGPQATQLTYGMTATRPLTFVSGFDPCVGSAPVLTSAQNGEVLAPLFASPVYTYAEGCRLANTASAMVGGAPAEFSVISDRLVRVRIPSSTAVGNQSFELSLSNGTVLATTIAIGVAKPLLNTSYVIGTQLPDTYFAQVVAEPNSAYAIGVSYSLVPSSFPGAVDLDIGNGGAEIFLLTGIEFTDSLGEGFFSTGPQPGLPVGETIFTQAVVFDLSILQLVATNVGATLVIP